MQSRRKFLKKSAVASLALAVNPLDLLAKNQPENNNTIINKPIVLSTWNFGLKAKAEPPS